MDALLASLNAIWTNLSWSHCKYCGILLSGFALCHAPAAATSNPPLISSCILLWLIRRCIYRIVLAFFCTCLFALLLNFCTFFWMSSSSLSSRDKHLWIHNGLLMFYLHVFSCLGMWFFHIGFWQYWQSAIITLLPIFIMTNYNNQKIPMSQ